MEVLPLLQQCEQFSNDLFAHLLDFPMFMVSEYREQIVHCTEYFPDIEDILREDQ